MASVLQQYRRRASQLPSGPYSIENLAHRHYRVVKVGDVQPVVVLNGVRLTDVAQWLRDQQTPVTAPASQSPG